MVVRATGTPENVATVRFVPDRVQVPPERCPAFAKITTTARTAQSSRMTGKGPIRPVASHTTPSGVGGGGKPLVAMNSSPWRTMFIERVITIGGTRRMAMPTPLTIPTSTPPSRMTRDDPDERAVLAARQRRQQDRSALERPRHGQVDPAADDDDRLTDGDDPGERRDDQQRRHVVGVREPRREETDQDEQDGQADV